MHHEVNLLKQDGRMQYTTHHLPEIKGCLDFLIFSTPSEGVVISAKSLTPLEGVELLRSLYRLCGSVFAFDVPSYSFGRSRYFRQIPYSFGRSGSVESIGRSDGRGEWAV